LGDGIFAVTFVPTVFGAFFALLTGTAWAAAYVVLVWVTTLIWFGLAPPGWLPKRPAD
jgi:hypothetical protein